jgi:hypothetical protein
MAETKASSKTAAAEQLPAALASAAAATDPAVHQLLAAADVARQNGDADAERAVRAELRKLGYQ